MIREKIRILEITLKGCDKTLCFPDCEVVRNEQLVCVYWLHYAYYIPVENILYSKCIKKGEE